MSRLADLADVLALTRVVGRDRWGLALRTGSGDLGRILAAIGDEPPEWWDGAAPAPPGLTDYQIAVIRTRFAAGELDRLPRDLALNQFLLLDKLGQGGQGEVYRARQLNPGRFVAVKTLIRDTDLRRRRFEQEARTMMQVRHPAVARFYQYERVRDSAGRPTNEYLIAMELLNGTDLNRIVRKGAPVPWQLAAKWTADLLGGLEAIHQLGFVHRDVKPENAMILGMTGPDAPPAQTQAKLLDFGAIRRTDADSSDSINRTNVFVGTMEYAPPEQWTGQVTPSTDIYALGATLYFALTGRSPFQQERRDINLYRVAHTEGPVPDLKELGLDVPSGLNRLFRKMMAKGPEERGGAGELAENFQLLLRRKGVVSAPAAPPPPPDPPTPPPFTPPKGVRKPTSSPARKPAAPVRGATDEPRGVYFGLVNFTLSILERLYIRGHHRYEPGQEPATTERLAALVRRPLFLLTVVILLGLLIFWAR